MNARYDAEYEHTYDAANKHDELEYTWYLWEWKTKKAPRKSAQKEEIWWYSKAGLFWFASSSAPKLVSKRLLQTARTKASDRTKGYGARRRKQKDEGNPKGSRKVEMLRVRKTNKSNRKQGNYGPRWTGLDKPCEY